MPQWKSSTVKVAIENNFKASTVGSSGSYLNGTFSKAKLNKSCSFTISTFHNIQTERKIYFLIHNKRTQLAMLVVEKTIFCLITS